MWKEIGSEEKIEKLKDRYEEYAGELRDSLSTCKAELTPETWKDFVKQYQKNTAGLSLTTIIGRYGGELLEKKLEEHGIKEAEIPQIMAIITYPEQHTPLFESRLDLLTIGAKVQVNESAEEVEHEIGAWLNKNASTPVNLNEETE